MLKNSFIQCFSYFVGELPVCCKYYHFTIDDSFANEKWVTCADLEGWGAGCPDPLKNKK